MIKQHTFMSGVDNSTLILDYDMYFTNKCAGITSTSLKDVAINSAVYILSYTPSPS